MVSNPKVHTKIISVQTFFSPDSTLHVDNTNFQFKNKFPHLKTYEDEEEIKNFFGKTLGDVNDPNFDPEIAKGGAFFILRSFEILLKSHIESQ